MYVYIIPTRGNRCSHLSFGWYIELFVGFSRQVLLEALQMLVLHLKMR